MDATVRHSSSAVAPTADPLPTVLVPIMVGIREPSPTSVRSPETVDKSVLHPRSRCAGERLVTDVSEPTTTAARGRPSPELSVPLGRRTGEDGRCAGRTSGEEGVNQISRQPFLTTETCQNQSDPLLSRQAACLDLHSRLHSRLCNMTLFSSATVHSHAALK